METTIRFDIPEPSQVRLAIYNSTGQHVRLLFDKHAAPGAYTLQWRGRNDQGEILPSGMYFYELTAGTFHAQRKLLFLK
ncbi:MAG: gliding motility-associated C-terminal domain-containing protein [Deferribacteres bacterium]|nr:gliding motility-associated C-terminal domain-containing protein [candidate division KSB1 bacterium]MCB9502836.1 gliding motility-associated C-terminal domain-containing protein [Deferribacteres bacterium]